MAVSLLTALLESTTPTPGLGDPNFKPVYDAWRGPSLERRALMLKALYEILSEYAGMYTPAVGTVGTLLAKTLSGDITLTPVADLQTLRDALRSRLIEEFYKLRHQFP